MYQELMDRFLRYVKIDTQSQEDVEDRYPSTEKQKDLSKLLVDELKQLCLKDAAMDEYGFVVATFPSNLPEKDDAKVPIIGLLGHVDTSPEVSGKEVKPVVNRNYPGGDIVLPGDKSQVIRARDNPELKKYIGKDIITSDGTTLLGADDKAGIAEIMTMLEYLNGHPEIKHGTLRIGFTLDEEVGMGTEYFDVEKFGADFAYTVDGEKVGEVENETFNGAVAVYTVKGINVHPGYAKGKMVNSIRITADIVKGLENDPSPESTEKREGYLHPYVLEGSVESTTLKVLLRDFEMEGIEEKTRRLQEIQKKIQEKYPKARIDLEFKHQYKNMRFKLEEDSRVVEYAMEAVGRAGLEPHLQIIRGGTDGARLCYQGLLTPNIFTGGMNFHSKLEWIPVQAMEKTVETLVNLVQIWTEKSL
jgi:tripeptide aminopeptidase